MVANRQDRARQGTIQDLINGLLDREYNDKVQPVLNAVARSVNSGLIKQRLSELDAEVARLIAEDKTLTADNPVLRALLADLDDTMKVNGRVVDGAAEAVQQTGMDAAARIQRQLALPGMTDQQLARIGIVWNKPDPEAVARLIQYAESDAWTKLISKYGTDIIDIVKNQAIRGIAEGWSPLRTAAAIRNAVENLPGYQANNLMRTLQLTSYRDATAANQNVNVAVISQVIRIAALDIRTCLSCVALHGTVIWDSERDGGSPVTRVEDHYSGRCTSFVQVKGRPAFNVVPGVDWFNNLSTSRQQQQASFAKSPAKFEAFKNGSVTLTDFVHQHSDPVFGDMVNEASLGAAIKGK